jgi:uncharacterized membrane protein
VSDPATLARWVSDTLRAGTAIAAATIIVGVITGAPSVSWVGILLLTLTPAIQLAAAAAAFLRQREARYAVIAFVALGLLAGALVVAVVLAPAVGG